MNWMQAVAMGVVLAVSSSTKLPFPPGFKFGAATAAYQVEGGWNLDGKSENIWDRFVHEHPERIDDRSTGDVACDSYHNWRRDIEMGAELGLDFYRISLSWSRILPSGFPNHINQAGIAYYSNLIDGLLEKGMEPLVTIYHWDLPQSLQDLGGWANPLIVDWFGDYAKVVFDHFGDRVKLWLTLNEPVILCEAFYNAEVFPPAFTSHDLGVYLCSKHTLLAHAKAWRIYDELLKPKYHGRVSLSTHMAWFDPLTPEDEKLAELTRQNFAGRYAHAIYSKIGGWPPTLEKALAEVSLKRGYSRPQLPPFTQEEIEFVRGIRKSLVWLKQQYGNLEIMITENGLATKSGLDDQDRIQYYRDYLEQVLLAINEDGVNVTAYTAWSLMDNYEWNNGYTVKFGLYEVDFTDPERKRTPRASAHYYASIIRTHSLDVPTTRIQLDFI